MADIEAAIATLKDINKKHSDGPPFPRVTMTPERWRRIEEIYDAVLMRGEQERSAFLASACKGDDGLRHEVESLLGATRRPRDFLSVPPWLAHLPPSAIVSHA